MTMGSRLVGLVTAIAVQLGAVGPAGAVCGNYADLCDLPVHTTIEQEDLAIAIDVVLVGDCFSSVTTWGTAAQSAISTFKTQSAAGVYAAVPNAYNFHVVDVPQRGDCTDAGTTDSALGMKATGSVVITANDARALAAALNAPDVDVVIAIANSGAGRANAYYPSQLASGGSVRLRAGGYGPISHELGHALFQLADEYEEAALCTADTESSLYNLRNVTVDPTCFKFASTSGAGCVLGGHYCSTGVYRPASGCLMRASNNTAPCPVCQRTVRDILVERRTGVDIAEPWPVISAPAAGSTQSGVVSVQVRVFDDYFSPTALALVVDGIYRASATTTSTFQAFTFDTAMLADGAHIAEIWASDATGRTARSRTLSFNTANGTDTTAPAVVVGSPANGATVSGKVSIMASTTATDIESLVLRIDGVVVAASVGTTSVSYLWDTQPADYGAHVLSAVGVDRAQNIGTSAPVNITVEAPTSGGQGERPAIYVQSPQPWTGVGSLLLIDYSFFGAVCSSAALWLDGVVVATLPLPAGASSGVGGPSGEGGTASTLVNSAAWSLGPHQLEIVLTCDPEDLRSELVPIVRVASAAPQAFIVSPASGGGAVRGVVSVAVDGFDDLAVTEIVLLVDGVEQGSTSTVPGTIDWDTTTFADAYHSLVAEARDADGNTGRSRSVGVSTDNHAPTVTIRSPADGSTVAAGTVLVGLDAQDPGGWVTRAELIVDGATVMHVEPWYSSMALFTELMAGARTLQARARDSAGNEGLSPIISVAAATCTAGGCDDADACTADSCAATGICLHRRGVNCCVDSGDCDDGDACTTDSCPAATCQHVAVAGCCNHGFSCADTDGCTADICTGLGGTCSNTSAGCCTVDAECADANACTTDKCVGAPNGRCGHAWSSTCCYVATDCDDDNPCTTDTCDLESGSPGVCQHTDVGGGCCVGDGECDDGDLCTYDRCRDNACEHDDVYNCCTDAADCSTLNPCATMACTANQCVSSDIADCCVFDNECVDVEVCTDDRCIANACTNVESALCCLDVGIACDDGDVCTSDDACNAQNRCAGAAIAGCCHDDGDCADTDPCTATACDLSAGDPGNCTSGPIAGCCHDATECDDGDGCTADSCDASNACVRVPVTDCPDGGDGPIGGEVTVTSTGCACNTTGSSGWWLVGVLLFALRFRQARRW